jgi:hypothetical protein
LLAVNLPGKGAGSTGGKKDRWHGVGREKKAGKFPGPFSETDFLSLPDPSGTVF